MQQGHEAHEQMSRKHYVTLLLNVAISAIVMYFVMFAMIWSGAEFVQNINFVYMAILMATPMGILMLIMMGPKCPDRTLNITLYALFVVLFLVAFWATREQTLIGDRQFVRSMIPHHSGAILMCNRASLRDAEVRDLCFKENGIVDSQKREIAQMKAILARM